MGRLLVLLAALVVAALTASGASGASTQCWHRVLDDWAADLRVDGRYDPGCFRDAIANLPEDLRAYSSASQDIDRALHAQLAATAVPAAAPATAPHSSGGNAGFVRVLVLATSLALVTVVALAALR